LLCASAVSPAVCPWCLELPLVCPCVCRWGAPSVPWVCAPACAPAVPLGVLCGVLICPWCAPGVSPGWVAVALRRIREGNREGCRAGDTVQYIVCKPRVRPQTTPVCVHPTLVCAHQSGIIVTRTAGYTLWCSYSGRRCRSSSCQGDLPSALTLVLRVILPARLCAVQGHEGPAHHAQRHPPLAHQGHLMRHLPRLLCAVVHHRAMRVPPWVALGSGPGPCRSSRQPLPGRPRGCGRGRRGEKGEKGGGGGGGGRGAVGCGRGVLFGSSGAPGGVPPGGYC